MDKTTTPLNNFNHQKACFSELRSIIENHYKSLDIQVLHALYQNLNNYRDWLGELQWNAFVLEGQNLKFSDSFLEEIELELQLTENILRQGVTND